jgi:class 3 adenylate cyclase
VQATAHKLDAPFAEVQAQGEAAPLESREPTEPQRAERKLATVLFADLVSSTELGGAQDPEQTRAMLDRFYDAMTDELTAAGGTVEKFAGDAVMAAFGVPAAQEDHVERALHAALAMRRRMRELFGNELELRIGVNTGDVIVARAREQSSFVTGDVVNVAARLEQGAHPGDILVGERAASLVSGAFEFAPSMRIEAKGKPEGVECRRLIRALSLMRPRGLPGAPSTFVGRDEELARLRDAFERAVAEGRPGLVTVLGDAGIGKTRLMRELWAWLGEEAPEALRRTGRCPPHGHARAYRPIAEILGEHLGLAEADPPERVEALLGDQRILALTFGLDVAADLHPIVARDRLYDGWVAFVEDATSASPLVLLVEDVHWAEEALLELLERTLADVDGPLLLLATGRPEFVDRRPTWGRGRVPSDWIRLEPLAEGDVDRLVANLLAGELTHEVREALDRAEGNPLFLEELLAMLTERGREGAIPDTLRALIASRIDLLPAREKAALQAAAVIGRSFLPSSVRELLGTTPDFHALEQRDFVRRAGSSVDGEREVVFKHSLTREVAYGSLTRRDRAHLHGDFAEWLELRSAEREDAAAVLAHHFAEAVRPADVEIAWGDDSARLQSLRARAVSWLLRAAELAAGRYEVADALTLLERAPRARGGQGREDRDPSAHRARAQLPLRHRELSPLDGGCARARSRHRDVGRDLRRPRLPRTRPSVHLEAAAAARRRRTLARERARAFGARDEGARVRGAHGRAVRPGAARRGRGGNTGDRNGHRRCAHDGLRVRGQGAGGH